MVFLECGNYPSILIYQLNDKYKEDTTWISIVDKLQSGIDNDDQIQERIIAEIRTGKPIVVVTKSITDRAMHLLLSNSNNFIVIEEDPDKPNATRFTIENANMVTCLRTVLYQ